MVIKKVGFFVSCLVLSGMAVVRAAQDARVSAERAVIYADKEMTSPLGYISRGKKIRIGDISRNKGQVYPIGVGGKIAYIKASDVSVASDSPTEKLPADRLHQIIHKEPPHGGVALSYHAYNSQIRINHNNGDIGDKSNLKWAGFGLKGHSEISGPWDLQMQVTYMTATKGAERFRMVELTGGVSNRLFEKGRFTLRGEVLATAIPFINYSLDKDFRVNSYGFGFGGGFNGSYRFGENFGVEASAGIHYMRVLAFDVPSPYSSIAPTFLGHRISLGINYNF